MNTNQELWNNWIPMHAKSDFYDIDGFKKGKTSLRKIELAELTDVKDKTMLHLQCSFGLDSLSWARKGANVTGVDFSPTGIKLANELSEELHIPAEFICANIYDLLNVLNKEYDIVYTSYGVLGWLDDLNKWAKVVTHFLKKGGCFYIVEFHPFINMFKENWSKISNFYFHHRQPTLYNQQGSYIDRTIDFNHPSYIWPYTISEVLTALSNAGLTLEFFHEFPYSPYDCFPSLKEVNEGEYVSKEGPFEVPMTFSLRARK